MPGVLPEHINVVPIPPSKGSNIPLAIPLPPKLPSVPGKPVVVKTLFGDTKEITPQQQKTPEGPKLPFIARTFSHACPTRAPGDTYRMHSVLGAFFQGPISYEERKRRTIAALKGQFMHSALRHCLTVWDRIEENECSRSSQSYYHSHTDGGE